MVRGSWRALRGDASLEPEYVAKIAPDDAVFLDLASSHLLITSERVVFDI